MIQASSIPADPSSRRNLPPRDWVIIPLIMLGSIAALSLASEAISKKYFSEPVYDRRHCASYMDPWISVRRPANCSYEDKTSNGDSIKYTLNDHGYREDANLAPKTPGVFRIVMVGTSFGVSGGSSEDQSLANILAADLTRRTEQPVEIYNESIAGFPGLPQNLVRRFDDILAAQPDMILWQMTRWDIKADDMTVPDEDDVDGQPAPDGQQSAATNTDIHQTSLAALLRKPLTLAYSARSLYLGSHSATALNDLLARSQSQFIKTSLNGPDTIIGFVKQDRSQLWTERDERFDLQLAQLAIKAQAAHIPLVLTLLPSSVQAAMVSSGDWSDTYNPYRLDNDLRAIAERHGVSFVDTLPHFRNIPNPERGYRVTDGHPNAAGNRMIANMLADELTRGNAPVLRVAPPPAATAKEQAK
jgi:hypothetical protein